MILNWINDPTDMEQKQLLVIAVVAILLIVAIGAVAFAGDESSDEYRSDNTDCRLKVLGNADENDYLDERDVEKIKEMMAKGETSRMADANGDGKVDLEDLGIVQSIIDARYANQGKDFSQKEKVNIKYLSVDNEPLPATYPVGDIIIANTQRALELIIALGVEDRVKGICVKSPVS